ncbi:hypothetical protein [Ahniella affigens]|nr:hypothetical protein [Ahniella affigens]
MSITLELDGEMLQRLGKLYAELPDDVDFDSLEITETTDGSIRVVLPGWVADDGNAEVEYEDAKSGREAAEEYVSDGDWGNDRSKTTWVKVCVWRRAFDVSQLCEVINERDEEDQHKIEIEPEVPECEDGKVHEWVTPYSVLGGLRENPGVWGHGGGVVAKEICRHCGVYQITDTWAQDPEDGEQGLTSTEYKDADQASRDYVQGLRDEVCVEA